MNKFLHRGTYFPGKPGWKERTVSAPDVVEFVEYSLVLSFLSILINVCKERSLYDITIFWSLTYSLKKRYSFFNAIEKILVVAQWLIHVKTRKPVLKILKISTSSCHEVPNGLSNLLHSNCQSKYQCCGGRLPSSHQKNIRFECNLHIYAF